MRKPQLGSTIVVALLITVVMATLAITLLGQRVTQRTVVNARFTVAQAKALAWSGLEDARVKLMKSRDFPPGASFSGENFSYSEDLRDETNALVGRYFVEIDLRNENKAIIVSSGQLAGHDSPSLMLRAELDTELSRRAYDMVGTETVESRPFRWMKVETADVHASR